MTAREFLGRYRAAQEDIRRAERLIKKVNEQLEVQGVNTTSERVQSSSTDDRTARLVAELVDARTDLEDAKERALRVMREINSLIELIPDPQQKRLVELRYLEGRTWEDIANEIHVSYRHVFRVRSNAFEAVDGILDTCHCMSLYDRYKV